ncbi:MAG: hypothetical protein J5I81_12445 [Nitrococcus mobilis]|nr:hypothetical protein [Nitrococcus mobilis]
MGGDCGNGIVHIGYHKTATTWFQRRLYPFVENYRYLQPAKVRNAFLYDHTFVFDPQTVRAWLELDGGLPPILCEEELSGNFQTGGHLGALSKDIAGRIHSVLPRAAIVIFIRNQLDMIASAYAQYIKRGGTHGPRRFLFPARYRKGLQQYNGWKPYTKPLFLFDHFAYLGLIRHYRALFGVENVHVFAYESFRRDARAFLADYIAQMGVALDLDRVDFDSLNASYRHRTLRLARLLHHISYRGDVVDRCSGIPIFRFKSLMRQLERFNATRLAGRVLSSRELLGSDIVAFIQEYFAESNRRLADETGLPLAAYGYPGATSKEPATGGTRGAVKRPSSF